MAKILVIDNCPDFLVRAACVLKRENHDVLDARDALAGLQRAVEEGPDLIVVSEDLDGLDGFEMCERLSRETATRSIPILLVGEDVSAESLRTARRAGAHSVLSRATSLAEWTQRVTETLYCQRVSWMSGDAELTSRAPSTSAASGLTS